jgi:hypothetical protein
MTSRLEQAKAVADAVLYEGYLLYPYRASAEKNQARWQFGVLTPPSYVDTGEHSAARTECLIEPGEDPVLHLRVRYLQVQARTVERACVGGYERVDSLTCNGKEYLSWDEAVECEQDFVLRLADLRGGELVVAVGSAARRLVEELPGGAGRIVRERWPVEGELRCSVESLPGPFGVVRLRCVLANISSWEAVDAVRPVALRRSMIAAHTVLALTDAEFISLLEPPEWAKGYVEDCVNEHTFPVLLGRDGDTDSMLSSPIILYDYPEIAPESQGEFYDSTEMDEMLTLRTLTMTEEEKRQARATDDRAAAIMDRVGDIPTEFLERLHGAVRYLRPVRRAAAPVEDITERPGVPWWQPGADDSVSPESDSVLVNGISVGKGSKVVLRPGSRRSDAQDMFLAGKIATVEAVLFDVDEQTHIAVRVLDDPAAELQVAHGRFRYFAPNEVEPVREGQVHR